MHRRVWAVALLASLVLAGAAVARADEEAVSDATILEEPDMSASKVTETEPVPDSSVSEPEPTPVGKDFKAREGAQKYEFQAEVSRLMDIIINSLYSNKDIFLRELISNAADALDKLRFLSLTDKSLLGEGDQAKLEIQIKLNPARNMLTIRDRGIGMTKDDLVKNLGTIAKSGTSSFLEQMQKGGDLNLIGQFGVGFYSVYLVGDYVEVITKHNDDKQYIWESGADGNFAISEDTEGEPLGRGTEIRVYLKEEAQEYKEESKLRELVAQYSEFINFPIYLWTTKETEVEVPDEEAEAAAAAAREEKSEEDIEDEDEDKDKDDAPKMKKVKQKTEEWEQLNTQNAIWLRDPSDVAAEEYEKFYQAIAKNPYDKPKSHAHFKAEGDVEFKAILFIPGTAPPDLMDNYYTKKNSIKLYVRRVFISDDFEDLMPKYLRWIIGLVDSDTLPLNVSREMLQMHGSLKTIKKKLVRKALDMIRKIADSQTEAEEEEEEKKKDKAEKDDEDAEAAKEAEPEALTAYDKLWKEFGKAIKMGIVEDSSNRNRLAKLLRVFTSKSPDKLVSLETYVARMKPDQKHIYFVAGQTKDEVRNSPFVEKLTAADYEVIYFTDPLDEYVMSNMPDFDDHKFQDVTKDDLKIGKDKAEKKREKKVKEEFKDLTKWWKEQLGSDVIGVKVSKRLANTPVVVVTSKHGWSANMERIMKAQAMGDSDKQSYMRGQKTLEINPYHPLIQELKLKHEADAEGEQAQLLAKLLYETALLESGFQLADNKAFNQRVYSLVKDVLDIKKDITAVQEPADDPAEEDDDEEEEVASPKAVNVDSTASSADEPVTITFGGDGSTSFGGQSGASAGVIPDSDDAKDEL